MNNLTAYELWQLERYGNYVFETTNQEEFEHEN